MKVVMNSLEGGFGESFRNQEGVIDKLLNEGKSKNEDIKMLFNGVDELIRESEVKLNNSNKKESLED